MTINEALSEGRTAFTEHHLETPFLDACLLLAHTLGRTKEYILASGPDPVDEKSLVTFRSLVARRLENIPVSYLRGVKEFYGREFLVDPRVLVPRPDTETLVETVLSLLHARPEPRTVHDLCTGSGCIALTLKLENPYLQVSASDISPEAGEVFRENCRRLGVSVPFILSDLLSSVPGTFDIITANPPYLTDEEYAAMAAAGWPEPRVALAGGLEGLDIFMRLIEKSVASLAPKGYLVCEAAPGQFEALGKAMEKAHFSSVEVTRDLAGRERVIIGQV
ncbi:MAG: peptide chain release factor N(5)-glutamine methyltransferase [Spirochaetales bacterium]|nr:peptide chain release factor N(5)-glutamine methyltransferase [Spirochaetales bacterium]